MSDIVERLRNANVRYASETNEQAATRRNAAIADAAAEIERLREGYARLERILTKDSLTADERASDALEFVRYMARAALEAAKKEGK